jgi:hypothetical protein
VKGSIMTKLTRMSTAVLLSGCLCLAQAQTSSKQRVKAFAKLPDWSGLWEFDVYVGESIGQSLTPEGLRKAKAYTAAVQPSFTPTWQPKIEEAKKKRDEAIAADPNQPPAPTGHSTCNAVPPFPATMLPGLYEWRVTPEETTLISDLGSVRHIYTDGRSHPPKDELWPTTQGNSIGHWDGDTLVVDTIAIKFPIIYLAAEGGFAVQPLSSALHTIERIRMVNHNEMQIRLTADDPIALAKPIEMTITWDRVSNYNRMDDNNADECDPATDRHPVVNGRFTTLVTPVRPATDEPPQ